MIVKFLKIFISSTFLIFFNFGCASKTNEIPSNIQYPGYKIIDSTQRDTTTLNINKGDKIAVVLKNISTTSYSYLEPRYNNSMVHFDGKSNCCTPSPTLIGNSGLVVYKFSFIGKGTTTINIIARQKGLSTTANSLENDIVNSFNIEVD